METLSDRIKSEAVSLGLCAGWTADWKEGSSKDEMLEKFVRGIDFCIEHNWPSTEVMKRDFGDVIHAHGVYVDENVKLHNPKTIILNGNCEAEIIADGFSAPEIYVRHNSVANIKVSGFSVAHISVYDNAKLNVSCDEHAKCFVYKYGCTQVSSNGSVIIRERQKKRGL